jgi:PleD family two-component response regulator
MEFKFSLITWRQSFATLLHEIRQAVMGKRILIVDDQATIALLLRDRLEKLGFEVETAANGLEGIEILRTVSIEG